MAIRWEEYDVFFSSKCSDVAISNLLHCSLDEVKKRRQWLEDETWRKNKLSFKLDLDVPPPRDLTKLAIGKRYKIVMPYSKSTGRMMGGAGDETRTTVGRLIQITRNHTYCFKTNKGYNETFLWHDLAYRAEQFEEL